MSEFDDIRDRLAEAEQRVTPDTGIIVLGDEDSDEYPTPAEFEERYGCPPAESDALIIRVPAGAEGY